MTRPIVKLVKKDAKHAYDVDAEYTCTDGVTKNYTTVEVHANTRTQAAAMVKEAGYTVRSVNMVG
jgi:hypothetical protein